MIPLARGAAVLSFVAACYVRFSNLDLTEAELMLRYPLEYIGIFTIPLGAWLLELRRGQK